MDTDSPFSPSAPQPGTKTIVIDQVTQAQSAATVVFILSLLGAERRWVGARGSAMLRTSKSEVRSIAAWVDGEPVGAIVRRTEDGRSDRVEAGLFLVARHLRHKEIGRMLLCIAILQEWLMNKRIFAVLNEGHSAMFTFLDQFGVEEIGRWKDRQLGPGKEVELRYPRAAVIAARELVRLMATMRFRVDHPLMQRRELVAWVRSLAGAELPGEG